MQPTDPGHQDDSFPAGPSHKATRRYSPFKPRASRKPQNDDPPHITARISNLPPVGKRIMSHYAGNGLTSRIRVLEKLEDYQNQYNDAPVVKVGTRWTCGCGTCARDFETLQKAAIHVVSNEWKLRPWHCPKVGCGRVYGSSNELTRHLKDPHRSPNIVNASIPQLNFTTLPRAASPSTRQTTGTTQQVTQRPSLVAMAAPSANAMRHVPAPVNRQSPYTQHPDIAYNQQFGHVGTSMFIGQDYRELPEATYPPVHNWNYALYQDAPYSPPTSEQLATSWANNIPYEAPRRQDSYPGFPGQIIDFQDGSQQPPFDAPQPSRRSNRLRQQPENRTDMQSTSQNRPGAGTPPAIVRDRSGEYSTWEYAGGSRQATHQTQ